MNELQQRIKASTPRWFKKVIKISLVLAAAGGAMLGAEKTVPGFHLPTHIETFAQYFVVAGIVAAAVAKTAKEDNVDA